MTKRRATRSSYGRKKRSRTKRTYKKRKRSTQSYDRKSNVVRAATRVGARRKNTLKAKVARLLKETKKHADKTQTGYSLISPIGEVGLPSNCNQVFRDIFKLPTLNADDSNPSSIPLSQLRMGNTCYVSSVRFRAKLHNLHIIRPATQTDVEVIAWRNSAIPQMLDSYITCSILSDKESYTKSPDGFIPNPLPSSISVPLPLPNMLQGLYDNTFPVSTAPATQLDQLGVHQALKRYAKNRFKLLSQTTYHFTPNQSTKNIEINFKVNKVLRWRLSGDMDAGGPSSGEIPVNVMYYMVWTCHGPGGLIVNLPAQMESNSQQVSLSDQSCRIYFQDT